MLIRSPCPNAPRSRGMTLIEVLVAMVVISVGLLGIAALQMLSLRNSQGAYLRTQATAGVWRAEVSLPAVSSR